VALRRFKCFVSSARAAPAWANASANPVGNLDEFSSQPCPRFFQSRSRAAGCAQKTPIRRKRTGASGLSQCAAGSVRAHGSEDLLAQRAARSLHALRALARLGARSSLICCGATNRISRSRGGGNDCPSPDECRPYCLDKLASRRANHTVEYRNGAASLARRHHGGGRKGRGGRGCVG